MIRAPLLLFVNDSLTGIGKFSGRFRNCLRTMRWSGSSINLASRHTSTGLSSRARLIVTVWGARTSRPTKDIDLLAHTENSVDAVVAVIQEICNMPLSRTGSCLMWEA